MWFFQGLIHSKVAEEMANSVDPDQTDLGLHRLPRPVCPKTLDHYDMYTSCGWQNRIFGCVDIAHNTVLLFNKIYEELHRNIIIFEIFPDWLLT